MGRYNKALVAFAGLVLTVVNIVAGGNHIVQFVISALTVLGVHQVPNLETGVEAVAADVKAAK